MSRKSGNPSEIFSLLRKEAEKYIASHNADAGSVYSNINTTELLHELNVQQIELEMQNEQLRISNDALEIQRAKFAGLYDIAPVGYFILDEYGIIKEVNDTGCTMLGVSKNDLVKKNFLEFITADDGDIFINFLESIQLYENRESCQLTIVTPGGKLYTQIEGIAPAQDDPEKLNCYVAVVDITERKNADLEQEKRILAATIMSQENERTRISEALHDSVGQLLYGIRLKMDHQNTSESVSKDIYQLLDQAIAEIRNISFELAPSILKDFGLPITLNEMGKRLGTRNLNIQVITDLQGRVDLATEVTIFRVIQELVNNSIKHAGAGKITISVKRKDVILIEVTDDGCGFQQTFDTYMGSGLAAIRNRLSLYEGQMNIESTPGKGSRIQITLKG